MQNAFTEHITHTTEQIAERHRCRNWPNFEKIIVANAPKEYLPACEPKTAIILIHGLWDSPSIMQSLFEHFSGGHACVRSLLLPGHGMRAEDLLGTNLEAWQAHVDFAIESLPDSVSQAICVGFSLGAALSVLQAPHHDTVKGVVLMAPLIKTSTHLAQLMPALAMISRVSGRFSWFAQHVERDYAKYQSYTLNSMHQAYRATQFLNQQKSHFNLPMMTIISDADETVSVSAAIAHFHHQHNPDNFMLIYSAKQTPAVSKNVETRCSIYNEFNLLDFSHVAVPVAPNHTHYGTRSDYVNFHHYPEQKQQAAMAHTDTIYYGAINKQNLLNFPLARSSYNPDFPYMIEKVEQFIANCFAH